MFQHPKMAHIYVGVDSHKNSHTAVFLNCFYEKLGEITLDSTPSKFKDFLKQAEQYLQDGTTLAWGFEDIGAYGRSLVKFLLSENQLVKHVDANLVASERKAKNILNKTDSVDAECACRVLINRFDQLPNAMAEDKFWILKKLVTRRKLLVKSNTMAKNQFHSMIADNYPSYQKYFSVVDGSSGLAFFEKYPSPVHLENETVEELTLFLKDISKNRSGEKKATLILETVENDGVVLSDYQSARDFAIVSIIQQMKHNKELVKAVDAEIKQFLTHFDYPLDFIKGIDAITSASLIVEIGDISRFKKPASLAKYAGVAPVTHSSGNSAVNYANERGNRALNQLFFQLAIRSALPIGRGRTLVNPIFHDFYLKKIAEGKTKKQALKAVQRRLVNIVWRIMKDGKEYINPEPMPAPPKEVDGKTKKAS